MKTAASVDHRCPTSSSCRNSLTAESSPRPPLLEPIRRFHSHHGHNIQLLQDGSVAYRANSFADSIVFSERPLEPGEVFLVEIDRNEHGWSGHMRLGLSCVDPNSRTPLPTYALPDLNVTGRSWIFGITRNELIVDGRFHETVSVSQGNNCDPSSNPSTTIPPAATKSTLVDFGLYDPCRCPSEQLATDVGSRICVFYKLVDGEAQMNFIINGIVHGPLARIPYYHCHQQQPSSSAAVPESEPPLLNSSSTSPFSPLGDESETQAANSAGSTSSNSNSKTNRTRAPPQSSFSCGGRQKEQIMSSSSCFSSFSSSSTAPMTPGIPGPECSGTRFRVRTASIPTSELPVQSADSNNFSSETFSDDGLSESSSSSFSAALSSDSSDSESSSAVTAAEPPCPGAAEVGRTTAECRTTEATPQANHPQSTRAPSAPTSSSSRNNSPPQIYAVVDVYGTTKQVKIVPLRRQVLGLQELCRHSLLKTVVGTGCAGNVNYHTRNNIISTSRLPLPKTLKYFIQTGRRGGRPLTSNTDDQYNLHDDIDNNFC